MTSIHATEVIQKPIDDLIPYDRNPNVHPAEQITRLAGSIREWGFTIPILIDEKSVVMAGHGRLYAAQSLGMAVVPCIVAEGWTENQKRAYVIADNKLSEGSEWDTTLYMEELKELDAAGFDLEMIGLDEDFETLLYGDDVTEGLTDEDAVPSEPETPITVEGDVWILGNHRLHCGDSTSIDAVDRLMDGQKADMVFTDPPYGIEFADKKGNSIKNDDLNDEMMAKFNTEWQVTADLSSKGDCFLMAWQSPRKFYLLDFETNWKFFRLVTMYKSNRISFPHGAWINKTEPCCIFSKGKPRITKQKYIDDCYVYTHDKESHDDSNVGHPTPKPVKMIECHVEACAKKDDLVLDLFGGSGSTMIACEKLSRVNYSMELDPKYCDVIIKRWQEFTGDDAVLESTKAKYNDMVLHGKG